MHVWLRGAAAAGGVGNGEQGAKGEPGVCGGVGWGGAGADRGKGQWGRGKGQGDKVKGLKFFSVGTGRRWAARAAAVVWEVDGIEHT